MPFDPAYPPTNAPLASAPMRAQLNALNDDIQNRATQSQLVTLQNSLLSQSSNNTNAVSPLSQSADSNYNQSQIQDLISKIDELIFALRR